MSDAPSGKAVVLLDSGTSYSYVLLNILFPLFKTSNVGIVQLMSLKPFMAALMVLNTIQMRDYGVYLAMQR